MEGKTVDCTSTSPTVNSSLSAPACIRITIPALGGATPSSNSDHATTSREGMDCQEGLPRLRSQRRIVTTMRGVENEVRHKRRKHLPGESGCPVCGLTIRPGMMDVHLSQELGRLTRLPQSRPPAHRTPTPAPSSSAEAAPAPATPRTRPGTGEPGHGADWETYQRVKKNRQVRVRVKRRRLGGGEDEVTCPVCSKRLPVNPTSSSSSSSPHDVDDIHTHIDQCLRRSEEEDVELEDEVEVEYEEYTWCGQTRVRATQMLRAEGQLHALGTKVERGSEDELVDVCDDDDDEGGGTYGPSQYTDGDLPPRDLVTNGDPDGPDLDQNDPSRDGVVGTEEASSSSHKSLSQDASNTGSEEGGSSSGKVVEALRARVLELEQITTRGRYTCRVCHGEYETPLVSVVCWHVHCEQCWLPALATKKLCPQCSVITGPSDLRRVYL